MREWRIFVDFIAKTAKMQYRYGTRSKNRGGGGGTEKCGGIICPLVEIGLTYLPKCMALHLCTIFTTKHDF